MRRQSLLVFGFLLFAALLLWPLLSIANRAQANLGVPTLVLYLFVVWGAIVGFLAWVARNADRGDTP
jgi:apolipoprotein N-acyltransferase